MDIQQLRQDASGLRVFVSIELAGRIDAAADRIAELEAERDRLRGLIDEHNNECVRRCGEGEQEGVRCGYRPYFPRRCPECPRHEMIEVAALEGK